MSTAFSSTNLPEKATIHHGVEGKIQKDSVDLPRSLKSTEVLLKITHASVCGTDIHYIPAGIALGHEGVGIVEAIGDAVSTLKIGDRVGTSYLRNSCGHCNYCLTGREIWCYNRDTFGEQNFTTGAITDYLIGNETYLYKIPDSILSEHAAPLQCAGATVYVALASVLKPRQRVGILGIGGLGHMAIQFASKLGAEVVVFSTSASKKKEARGFGASEFILLDEPEKVSSPIDVLVVASSSAPDWTKFCRKEVLARGGTIVPLSAPAETYQFPGWQMFFDGYNLRASLVSSRAEHADMLAFAAQHDIKPVIETFEMNKTGIDQAFEKLKSGKMRYRGVLVA
ncbi:hypothetical protein H2200_007647 [Cladophialophora chaetospira]|uniref:Enoyl reductase (ER) domain-containing protein n=1 Tax=Cladophialophora chaetospira TaxID=386627 RepID=A0AA38X681_9EURO|nr:hypothetical protein H2200_007647 [Cladophialophora chaetospira]